jgi:hypothetical protein
MRARKAGDGDAGRDGLREEGGITERRGRTEGVPEEQHLVQTERPSHVLVEASVPLG